MEEGKIYSRIYRPTKQDGVILKCIYDEQFSNNLIESLCAYRILESDLKKIFEYIEPTHQNDNSNINNNNTYSHRLYELFVRICTEVESNLKGVLVDNTANLSSDAIKQLKITDYFKVCKVTKYHEYKVGVCHENFKMDILEPFSAWNSTRYNPLEWYQDYNNVKHNRHENFKLANLGNVINSLAALAIVLYAQYGLQFFNTYQKISMIDSSVVNGEEYYYSTDSLLSIKPPVWNEDEKYKINNGQYEIIKYGFIL